ncbi:recombinase RecT [Phyllobacterium sp. 628]|uniref:recombinase RecT n=1 Tax=Phyllobacterium sp. 628 TaxID=2718938 RepID=UPI0016622BFD|nr:recombinase RecT [Phyllobacterium sp. 628]QND53446.1 recombinase RecT [Phyllobacterium sp. 628]
MSQTTALQTTGPKPPVTLRTRLDQMTPEFKKALPGHISAEKFVRTAQTAIALTRNIEKIKNPQSLLAACTKAAADGLVLDGREAALVVDYNGEVQYRPMMRGLLKLAYNSGEIRGIVVEIARKGDVFRHSPTNLSQPIHHEINHEGVRGDPHTVYALAELKDGGIVHEVMSVSDVDRIRDRSDAYKAFLAKKIKSTPWSTDWSEMARKTVFRRLSKYLPSSSDKDAFHQAVERVDDDYSFDVDAATDEPAKPAPAAKKRGGAAAALKNVTPQEKQETQTEIATEYPDQENYDPDTGEYYDDGDHSQRPDEDI